MWPLSYSIWDPVPWSGIKPIHPPLETVLTSGPPEVPWVSIFKSTCGHILNFFHPSLPLRTVCTLNLSRHISHQTQSSNFLTTLSFPKMPVFPWLWASASPSSRNHLLHWVSSCSSFRSQRRPHFLQQVFSGFQTWIDMLLCTSIITFTFHPGLSVLRWNSKLFGLSLAIRFGASWEWVPCLIHQWVPRTSHNTWEHRTCSTNTWGIWLKIRLSHPSSSH